MLKHLRKNPKINKSVRSIIKYLDNTSNNLFKSLKNKWRTSGNIECHFETFDFKMYNECDDGLVGYFYYGNEGYHENQDLKLFSALSKKAKRIVDIGANTGLYSIISSLANPNSKIYAVEPYLINYNRLLKNIELNKLSNVTCLNFGLGAEEGYVNFAVPENGNISDVSSVNVEFSRSVYPELKWKDITVDLKTLDILSIEIGEKIDLIKCDVESYEMNVFKGAKNILRNDKPTILFESFLDNERKIFFNDILKEFDYYVYLVLKDGIVRLDNGFNTKDIGLNYLISSKKSSETYISFKNLNNAPEEIM